MTPGLTTAGLARALPHPPLGRVLDVGTGSGVLALLAARTGATVTATDLTERACTFTRFNAAFNGVEVRVRRGDIFEPVAEEQFDLVVSQPPFVVQPPDLEPTSYVHGGPSGTRWPSGFSAASAASWRPQQAHSSATTPRGRSTASPAACAAWCPAPST